MVLPVRSVRPAISKAALAVVGALIIAGARAPAQECPTTLGPAEPAVHGRFGWSVDVEGDVAVIGNLAGNGTSPGSAYVVELDTQMQRFEVTEPGAREFSSFGWDVAIGGGRVAIAAIAFSRDAAVYVYDDDIGDLQRTLTAPDGHIEDQFGRSLEIEGDILVVGAPEHIGPSGDPTGAAYLFDLATGDLMHRLAPPGGSPNGTGFGFSVAIEGTTVLVGAPGDQSTAKVRGGAAYVFDAVDGRQLKRLLPDSPVQGSHFGNSIAIDGTTALVGAWLDGPGSAHLFDLTTGRATHELTLEGGEDGDLFGRAVAIGGEFAAVSTPYVHVFDVRTGERQTRLPTDTALRSIHDDLGNSLAIDGDWLLAGAPRNDARGFDSGEIEIFRLDELPDTPVVMEPDPELTTVSFEITLPGIGTFVFERPVVGRIVAEAPLDCKPPKSFQVTDLELRPSGPEPTFEPGPGVSFTVNEPGIRLTEAGPPSPVGPDGSVALEATCRLFGTLQYTSPAFSGSVDLSTTGFPFTFTLEGTLDASEGPLTLDAQLPVTPGEFDLGLGVLNPTYRVSGTITARRVKPAYLAPIPSRTQKASVVLDFARENADKTKFSGAFDRRLAPALGEGTTAVLRIGAFKVDVPLDAKGRSPKGSLVKVRLKAKKKKATFKVSVKSIALRDALAALPTEEGLPRSISWSLGLPDGWSIAGVLEMEGKDKLKTDPDGAITRATLKMLKRK